jgi:hypothetical protein
MTCSDPEPHVSSDTAWGRSEAYADLTAAQPQTPAEQAEAVALRFAADIAAVNSCAWGQLLGAAGKLRSIGAPQARVIRTALRDERPGRADPLS